MAGRIFNLTGNNPATFSSQPINSNVYHSQSETLNNIANSQPIPTIRSSNDSQIGSPTSIKRRLTSNGEITSYDQLISRDSKREEYDIDMINSDQVKENLQSLFISKDNRDTIQNRQYSSIYNSTEQIERSIHLNNDNDTIKNLLNTVATLKEEIKLYKEKNSNLEEKIIQDNIRYEDFKLGLLKEQRQKDDERYQAFLKIENTYQDVLNKSTTAENHIKRPVEFFERGNNELKALKNTNKLMGYLTSLNVINQTENMLGISFDCEIASESYNRSLKFKLYIPNDDKKIVEYTPDTEQLNESTKTALPDFLQEYIAFEKQFLPIFFWRLSSSIQGTPNTN